jgi:hypothetical protein
MNPKENRIDRDLRRLKLQIDDDRVFDYARRAEYARKAQHILHEASAIRRSRPSDTEARARQTRASQLCHATVVAAYPQGFGQDFRRLKEGNASGMTAAVKFLEADPWFFRSGYTKAELIRYLIRIELPRSIEDRLRIVVLAVVDQGDRREFRHYCRLARKVDSPRLQEELSKRLRGEDPAVARRARWVLDALANRIASHDRRSKDHSKDFDSPHPAQGGRGNQAGEPDHAEHDQCHA